MAAPLLEYENQVLYGDCLEFLRQLPSNVFDAAPFDPPYGLGKQPSPAEILAYLQGADLVTGDFMGKDWQIPPIAFWRELYRVLKPGAYVASFGGTRTWDLIAMGARMVGFEVRDTIGEIGPTAALAWVYSSGMPKSTDLTKQIDKRKKVKRESKNVPVTEEARRASGLGSGLKPCFEPIFLLRKPLQGTLTANVMEHGTGALHIDACRVKHANKADLEAHRAMVEAIKSRGGSMANSWKNSSDLSGANDVTEAGRWPTNILLVHAEGCQKVGSKQVSTGGSGAVPVVHASAGYKGPSLGRDSRKEGDVRLTHRNEDGTETVDAYDCVSGCPVRQLDNQSGERPSTLSGRADPTKAHENPGDNGGTSSFGGGNSKVYADTGGASRFFPQFQAEWECADGCPVKALDDQSGTTTSGAMKREVPGYEGESTTGFIRGTSGPSNQHGDSGGASRFFPQFDSPFFYTGKVSKKEATLDGEIENVHVAKKPVRLIRWIIRLIVPKALFACPDRCVGETISYASPGRCPSCGETLTSVGPLIIDPYCGSGSTLEAAIEEGCRFTGIEREKDSYKTSLARVEIIQARAAELRNQHEMFDALMAPPPRP